MPLDEGSLRILEQRIREEIASLRAALDPSAVMRRADYRSQPAAYRLETGQWWLGVNPPGPSRPALCGEAIDLVEAHARTLVTRESLVIAAAVDLLIPDSKTRPAAYERICRRWPWSAVYSQTNSEAVVAGVWASLRFFAAWERFNASLFNIQQARAEKEAPKIQHLAPSPWEMPWPSNVAPQAVKDWIASTDANTRNAPERKLRDGASVVFFVPGDGSEGAQLARNASATFRWFKDANGDDWPVANAQLAWIYSAGLSVEKDRHIRTFPVSATRPGRVASAMLARQSTADPGDWMQAFKGDGCIEIHWDGKAQPYQLHLAVDEGESVDAGLAKALLSKDPDLLRDWFVLNRMAAEQGRSGSFRWSWDEHRKRTDYERRIANKNATDAELARATRRRLWQMKRTEIWWEAIKDDRKLRARLGECGLIDIAAELLKDDAPLVAAGKINSVLYKGARGGGDAHFTLIPEAALSLPAKELSLLALVSFPWRAGDDKGRASLKARTLWEYAGLASKMRQTRLRWPQCRNTLESMLSRLESKIGIRWTGGGDGPEALYSIEAPEWFRDRLVHRISPVLPSKATAGVPRTGAELRACREAIGISLRALAVSLKVDPANLSRRERQPNALVPAEWLPTLAQLGVAKR